jgi:GNAT superfamily N-acetyltransferase
MTTSRDIHVRPLREDELDAADRIMRVAFGTFLGLPEPEAFMGDASYVRGRWRAGPESAFAAEVGGELAGSNFATRWGSVGFFGPLTIRPDLWDAGVGKALMEPVMQCFERWGTRHAGLFTFAQSAKHVGLYRRFGFWPRFLTLLMSKTVAAATGPAPPWRWTRFSEVPAEARPGLLAACGDLTGAILEGLDVRWEIEAVAAQELGDTVLLWEGDALAGLAVCHAGAGTEAGSGSCYVKFGAVRPGADAASRFEALLAACEVFAAGRGAGRRVAGCNSARHEACRALLESGFRTETQGIAMQRPDEPGYNRAGAYLIDDWR